MKVMDKRIMVSLPGALYEEIRRAATSRYQSVAAFIRESLLEKIGDEFTSDQISVIEEGRRSFRAGKGTDWRKVKRAKV